MDRVGRGLRQRARIALKEPMTGPAFGFLLMARPPGRGAAVEVANGRLERGIWPLYEWTRNRDALVPGVRIAIYVGGRAQIIATAVVQEVVTPGRRGIQVDPPEFVTPPASRVLRLSRIVKLARPVQLRLLLPRLEMCPRNLQKWGSILSGGDCAVSKNDWRVLFGRPKP
jgi:hypothetical protein